MSWQGHELSEQSNRYRPGQFVTVELDGIFVEDNGSNVVVKLDSGIGEMIVAPWRVRKPRRWWPKRRRS